MLTRAARGRIRVRRRARLSTPTRDMLDHGVWSMNLKRLFWSSIALALGVGCSTVQVQTDWNRSTDFSNFHSYAWLSDRPLATGDPRFDNALVDQRIRNATAETLATKGFAPAPQASADFLMSYLITSQQKTDINTVYQGYGYGWGGWGGPAYAQTYVMQYELGTLILDVLDPKTKTLVWRGSGSARLGETRTPEELDALVRAAVEEILAK